MKKDFVQILIHVGMCFIFQAKGNETDKWYRHINIINDSGGSVDIYWINAKTAEAHPMAQLVKQGMEQPLNSFVGHTFEIRESPDLHTGLCGTNERDPTCHGSRFTVLEDDVDQQSK
jgi:hypothetical protein